MSLINDVSNNSYIPIKYNASITTFQKAKDLLQRISPKHEVIACKSSDNFAVFIITGHVGDDKVFFLCKKAIAPRGNGQYDQASPRL